MMIVLQLYQLFLATNVSTQKHKHLRKRMLLRDFYGKPLCAFGKEEVEK